MSHVTVFRRHGLTVMSRELRVPALARIPLTSVLRAALTGTGSRSSSAGAERASEVVQRRLASVVGPARAGG